MKRFISAILLISILLSGCSSAAAPAETTPAETVPETTAEPATEPTTEPTLSAEELFIQSLPEKVQQAHTLGIVDLDLLEELDRPCTIEEAARILQNVYNLRFYEDSWMLANTVTEENAAEPATRGWFMTMMYAADAEALVGVDSEDYADNLKNLTVTYKHSDIADTLLGYAENTGYVFVENSTDPNKYQYSFYGDLTGAAKKTADLKDFDGDIATVSYALTRFDRTNGEKLMTWDENRNLHFKDSMSIQEVVETALRYYNALEPKPDMVPYEEITHYDESIITPDLLSQESDLPEPSCSYLPAEWHGVRISIKQYNNPQSDLMVYEHEVQVIKEAGFNMIWYPVDFEYYHGRALEDGKMNENRLKELDQLLAWCMERDIHLNLACYFCVGWPHGGFSSTNLIRDVSNAVPLANSWKALAQRYADIPNRYLSFTLLDQNWGSSDEEHSRFLAPVVEAVREVAPDRCMIAKVGQYSLTGTGAAELGIALSSPCAWGEDFVFEFSRMKYPKSVMPKAVWPYMEGSELTDGNAAMSKDMTSWKLSAPDTVAAIAKEYGVGYMVQEWGPRISSYGPIMETNRYSDETMRSYLTDMTQVMKERGYGWCYTDWMGSVGIAFSYPLVEGAAYTQVEDYPLYIDEDMSALFREINQAS